MINFRPQVYLLIPSKKLAKFVELHICYRKYYDRPTLHYGDKTVKIMVAFTDMIFVLSGLSECFVQRSDGSNTFVSKFIVFFCFLRANLSISKNHILCRSECF